MSRVYKRLIVVNIFGGLFYVCCLLLWLWAALPYLPWLISLATTIQPSSSHPPVTTHVASQPPSLMLMLLASIIVVALLAATAYVLIKMPMTIGKTGEKITKRTSQYLVPVVSHHAKLSPKKRRQIATRLVVDIKIVMCIVPVVSIGLSFAATRTIPYDVSLLVVAFLAGVSLLLLSTQMLLAKLLHVPLSKTW